MRQYSRYITAFCVAALLLAACGSGEMAEVAPPKPTPIINDLVKDYQLVETKPETLLAQFKAEAKAQVDQIVVCKSQVVSEPVPVSGSPGDVVTASFLATQTNNQEAGIDEHDLVKVVGEYAYVLQAVGTADGVLRILRVHPAEQFTQVAQLTFGGAPIGLQVTANRVAVLTGIPPNVNFTQGTSKLLPAASQNQFLRLDMVDVTNPAAPVIVRTATFGASLVASRRIENTLWLVMNGATFFSQPAGGWNPYAVDCMKKRDAHIAQRKALIDSLTTGAIMVRADDTTGGVTMPIAADRFYTNGTTDQQLLIVMAIDMEGAGDDQLDLIYGNASAVYVSRNSLYAAQQIGKQSGNGPITAIHAFDITQAEPEYIATGGVKGTLLNQFAMSEHKGVLRVATGGQSFAENANNVFTLDATVPGLPQLGKVTGLGNGEKLYAVRFVEDTGYVVTFKKIDPLFVIDLADPKNPVVAGELKVPGYSTYLHPLAGGKLIGLGKDADDQGAFAWFAGLKLSLFDVSAPSAPSEVASEVIGVRGSDSPALADHHAFTYDAARQLLALPVTVCEGTDGTGSTFGAFSYSGLHLYEVTSSGFTLAGTVQDPKPTQISQSTCGWGTPTTIQRAVIMGDETDTQVLVIRAQNVELFDVDGGMTSLGVIGIK